MNNLLSNMRYTILCVFVIYTTFSSAAVIPINDPSDGIIEEPAMSRASPFDIPLSAPKNETTHTESETNRIVSSDDTKTLINEFNQVSTIKESDQSTELFNEVDQTYAKIGADGSAEILEVNGLSDASNSQHVDGTDDFHAEDGVSSTYITRKADGTKEEFVVAGVNEIDKTSHSSGDESTIIASEDHAFHEVERSDGASDAEGNIHSNIIYTSGNGENVDEIVAVDEADELRLSNDGHGLTRSTAETDILVLGKSEGGEEIFAVNNVDKKIGLHDDETDAVVDVDRTNEFHHSVDSEGNVEVSEVNSVARNVDMKDDDVDISLGIGETHSASAFGDKDGILGAYSGDSTSHTLRIKEGDVDATIGIGTTALVSGFNNGDGFTDVNRVEEVDRYFSMNDGEGGFALDVDERNQLHGIVDENGVGEGERLDVVNVAVVVADSTLNEVEEADDFGANHQDDLPCANRCSNYGKTEEVPESLASNAFNRLINKVDEYYAGGHIGHLNRMFGALLFPKANVQITININEGPPLNDGLKNVFPFMPFFGNHNN